MSSVSLEGAFGPWRKSEGEKKPQNKNNPDEVIILTWRLRDLEKTWGPAKEAVWSYNGKFWDPVLWSYDLYGSSN